MANVVAVGIATLDIINSVDGYPAEDSEVRATAQRRCRGGNATNTLVVLSQLGHRCRWAGVLAREPDATAVLADLNRHGVTSSDCLWQETGKIPTSYIVHNRRNGSRTIVHYRDLNEYPASAFAGLDLTTTDWLHFEGRNVPDTARMLQIARERQPHLPLSVEIEKPREGIEALLSLADVILVSRHYALHRGHSAATAVLQALRPHTAADLICAWGEAGAWALGRDGQLHHSPAFAPPRLIDTLGAGDTFNAGIIDGYLGGLPLATTLEAACRLAGRKCGHPGLDFIKDAS